MEAHLKLIATSQPFWAVLMAFAPILASLVYMYTSWLQDDVPSRRWWILAGSGSWIWYMFLRHVVGNPGRHHGHHGFGEDIISLADEREEEDSTVEAHCFGYAYGNFSDGPTDLSDEEMKLLQFIFAITFKLGNDQGAFEEVWRMIGGGKPIPNAPDQLSFTALRYHLAFTAYTTAAICMRTPLLHDTGGQVLRWIMCKLLSERVFGYSEFYWPSSSNKSTPTSSLDANPFFCRENIMW